MEYVAAKYDAETLTVDYITGDDSHLIRSKGTAAWRFNNPGNLRPGTGNRILYGAIGIAKTKTNKSFLIFSSYEEARKQKKLLIRTKYNQRTIYTMLAGIDDGAGNMIEGYAPASDQNNPQEYASFLASRINRPTSTRIQDPSDSQLETMMDAMERKEGYHNQKESRSEQIIHATAITISDGARPMANAPVKIHLGEHERETYTDYLGRLPVIPHIEPSKSICILMPTEQGNWDQIFSSTTSSPSQSVVLFNSSTRFSAPTAPTKSVIAKKDSNRNLIRYIVKSGDKLAGKTGIASKFKTTVPRILGNNTHIRDGSKIYPGQVITIYGNEIEALTNKSTNSPQASPSTSGIITSTTDTTTAGSIPPQKTKSLSDTLTRSKEGRGAPIVLLDLDQKQAPWMQIAISEAKKWGGKPN